MTRRKKNAPKIGIMRPLWRDERGGANLHKLKNMLHRAEDAARKVEHVPVLQTRAHRLKIVKQRARLYVKACKAASVRPDERMAMLA